jgi:hypothetical protein
MSQRRRLWLLAGITLVVLLGAGGYLAYARHQATTTGTGPSTVDTGANLASVSSGAHVVFRNTALGTGYGQVAVVALDRPDGQRAITPASCERVYATAHETICLSADRGLVTTYRAQMLGPDWTPRNDLPLTGLPSRARLSPDGTRTATTTFVYGDSYNSPGKFSTRTLVTNADGSNSVDLEQFQLVVDGRVITAADRNLWGVTFADDDHFYATAASAGKTWLVDGRLSTRRMTALREDVECPSLSPDRTRIAFKKRGDLPPGHWRVAVYDLATGRETLTAETHSVDDQVEWLDNDHLLYALPRAGSSGAATSDVWVVPADGTGAPSVFVHDAFSPAVVR